MKLPHSAAGVPGAAVVKPERRRAVEVMGEHPGHTGVHDRRFNNISACGNPLRSMNEWCRRKDAWHRRSRWGGPAAAIGVQYLLLVEDRPYLIFRR